MKPRLKILAFFCALFCAWLWNCQQPDTLDPDHVLLSIKVDSSYEAFDTLWVAAVFGGDTTVLFKDSLKAPDQLLRSRVDHAPSGEVQIIIKGFRKGAQVYEEARVFNLGEKTLISSDVKFDLDHNHSLPPVLKLLSADTPVSAGDTLRLRVQMDDPDGTIDSYFWYFDGEASPISMTASPGKAHVDTVAKWVYDAEGSKSIVLKAVDNTGQTARLSLAVQVEASGLPRVQLAFADTSISIGDTLSIGAEISDPDGFVHFYAWDFTGKGSYDPNLGLDKSLENVTGTHVYPDTGTFWVTLKATDDAKRAAVGKARVRVLLDPPRVDAGADKTVLAGSQVSLQGSARDSLGRIVSYAWKIGAAAFATGTGSQITFTAPAKEDTIHCVLKAVDDDGNAVEDTAYVTVVFPSEALLARLAPSLGKLSPPFDRLTTKYVDTVAFGSDSLDFVLAAENPNSAVNVAGKDLGKGDTLARVSAKVSPVVIKVVSPDGKDNRQYEIAFAFRKSGDASLKSLAISAGKFSSDFAPGTYIYDLGLDSTVATLSLTPTAGDPANASIRVEGKAVVSGAVTEPLPLSGSADTIFTQVTAQDGTSHTYEIRITRKLASGTDLADLATSVGDLGFQPSKHDYAITVPLQTTTITFTPTLKDTLGKIRLNGVAIASGQPATQFLKDGDNDFLFSVVAQNVAVSTYYDVHVNRGGSRNADIGGMLLNRYSRTRGKRTDDLSYSLQGSAFFDSVEVDDSLFDVQVIPADPKTSITFNSKTLAKDSTSERLPLLLGDNTFTLVSTPEDTTAKKTFTLKIHRGIGFERLYGAVGDAFGRKVLVSKNGGYILIGLTYLPTPAMYMVRTDTLGDTLWANNYTATGMSDVTAAQELGNGNIVIGGLCGGGACLVMTDPQGYVQWNKPVGGSLSSLNDFQQTADGGFVFTGSIYAGSNGYDVFVGRTNSSGDSLWTKTYAGPAEERGRSIALANGGGFFVLEFDPSGTSPDTSKTMLMRIDGNGDFRQRRPLSSGEGITLRKASGGGYVVAGTVHGTENSFVSKLDSGGADSWTHFYGASLQSANSIDDDADGGYVIGGDHSTSNPRQACLAKIDAQGNLEWSRTFGSRAAYGLSAAQTPSGSYLLLGYTYPPTGTQTSFYLVKTDANGSPK